MKIVVVDGQGGRLGKLLVEGVKAEFDKNGVEMTYPHVNVHMVP